MVIGVRAADCAMTEATAVRMLINLKESFIVRINTPLGLEVWQADFMEVGKLNTSSGIRIA